FESARTRSATEAATLLRTQGAFLARSERAAMLNAIAYQLLRQRQAASLADLRRIRADWNAIGPGAGLDPIVAMELEAAESAAERLLLAEILQLIRDGRFTDAADKIGALESPRHLPAAVVQSLPGLRDELRRADPLVRMRALLNEKGISFRAVWQPAAKVPREALPDAVVRPAMAWSALDGARGLFAGDADSATYSVEHFESALKRVADTAGAELAGKLRVEAAARLFLGNRPKDSAELLEGAVEPVHAAAVLGDLRAAVLGRGEIVTPQVAALVPETLTGPPAYAAAVLPPDQLAKWKPPSRKPGVTTVDAAIAEQRKQLTTAVSTEADAATAKVAVAADVVRAALAAEAAPLKEFLEKVEAVRGKPLSMPLEHQLATVAGTRGLTVAETVGVLAADADRPASAARLLAAVPVLTSPGAFAAVVEVSGRAPAAFTAHPDAGFKVPAGANRARVRDAVAAVLGAYAAKAAAGQDPPQPDRAELETEVAKRLGVAADALRPAEFVQALLDVCRDRADDHTRLGAAGQALDELIADIEQARGDEDDAELRDAFAIAKTRRVSVRFDRKRAEIGAVVGCQLLGAYGAAARPAAEWLGAQGEDRPWRAAAARALARVAGDR
ncbi:MAG: hypothetical protein J0I06_08650, partial [Planctomycetes bacterium]|nr:hypothetical protein [Planctomycetota bacterium]